MKKLRIENIFWNYFKFKDKVEEHDEAEKVEEKGENEIYIGRQVCKANFEGNKDEIL